ncbi:hypothetical protein LO762_10935 [Actinocorallia sp. API 0066]|uniref:tetratricopeptide repeat protein n=1 Tax=Actinocorallia sp. API 0066 TaxID=2896846 RepID=UPI001E5B6BA6|nr:tetratricopeptide repeat protein [Actinocorallia sp. API 0066]MCD0449701.1 hypothetical protein [Actinocorallia sp. API 0066]
MNEFTGDAENVVQIGALHGDFVLRGPARPVPREIQAVTSAFVDREQALEWLLQQCADATGPTRILVLTGLPGVGKSTLARRFAEHHRDHFTGGQLLAACTDHPTDDGLVDVTAMVGSCLSALGVAAERQPATLADKVKLFRSRTADAPFLVLVDGATEAAQVRPLVPNAPGSVVLVTASADLSELFLDGAEFHELRELDEGNSRDLFTMTAGDGDAADLVGYCGGHPLAILVLAGRVRGLHDLTVADLGRELADERRRLHALSLGGRRVSAQFTVSYDRLPAPTRHLYRRLALLPTVDFTVDTAAAVSGALLAEARAMLGVLSDVHLVQRASGGRFRFHGLVKAHARELAEADPAEQREAALAQVVGHYLRWAAHADRTVMGARSRIADHAVLLADVPDPFGGKDAARAWFQAERGNLPVVVRAAHDAGFHTETWQLAEALVAFYLNYRYLTDWVVVGELGAAAALAAGEPRAEARLRIGASRAHMGLRDARRAWAELERAAAIADADADLDGRPTADLVLAASVWEHRARVLDARDPEAALRAYDRARALNERAGEHRGVALTLYFQAETRAALGRDAEARAQLEDALARFRALDDSRMAARALISLARLLSTSDGGGEARPLLETALTELADTHYEAEARELLAALTDDPAAARAHLQRAAEIYLREGDPRADDLTNRPNPA